MIFELVKRICSRKKLKETERLRRYQQVYNTTAGRWVLEDILAMCHYGETALGKDTEETYFRLGEHNVGVELASLINANILEMEKIEKDGENVGREESTEETYS